MNYHSHLLFALLLALYTKCYFGGGIFFIFFILVGALLPDLDETKSYLGRRVPLLPGLSKFLFGHRGIYHSLPFAILLALFINIFSFKTAVAIFIGYMSHLFLDATTKQGIQPFWPLKARIHGPITTGSIVEKAFTIILFALIVLKLF
jgi:inner membrane protein